MTQPHRPEPHLRAADTDRESVATALGRHMAAGRLTVAEYDERLAEVYAAKTYGELEALTSDLPAATPNRPVPAPAAGSASPTTAPPQSVGPACAPWGALPMSRVASHGAWSSHTGPEAWRAWASTSAIVLTVYLAVGLIGDFGYFWPIWVIGPWGAVLLIQTLAGAFGRNPDDGGRRSLGS